MSPSGADLEQPSDCCDFGNDLTKKSLFKPATNGSELKTAEARPFDPAEHLGQRVLGLDGYSSFSSFRYNVERPILRMRASSDLFGHLSSATRRISPSISSRDRSVPSDRVIRTATTGPKRITIGFLIALPHLVNWSMCPWGRPLL